MTHVRAAALSATLVLLMAACGSAPTAALATTVAPGLQQDVLAVTRAAAASDVDAAAAALARLHQHLTAAQRAGLVSPARATQIEASAARVSADLRAIAAGPSTTSPPARVDHGEGQDKKHSSSQDNQGGGGGGD
jgi:hypothetical protein